MKRTVSKITCDFLLITMMFKSCIYFYFVRLFTEKEGSGSEKNEDEEEEEEEADDDEAESNELDDDWHNRLLRVTLLLQFMEHLEKFLYNAFEGCTSAMLTPPKVVRTFFRNNRTTCHDWLQRNRLYVMYVATHAQQPALVVRHAYDLLRDVIKQNNMELEHVLLVTVRALVRLRCPEAILGLYAWCKEKVERKFLWMKSAAEIAAGR